MNLAGVDNGIGWITAHAQGALHVRFRVAVSARLDSFHRQWSKEFGKTGERAIQSSSRILRSGSVMNGGHL